MICSSPAQYFIRFWKMLDVHWWYDGHTFSGGDQWWGWHPDLPTNLWKKVSLLKAGTVSPEMMWGNPFCFPSSLFGFLSLTSWCNFLCKNCELFSRCLSYTTQRKHIGRNCYGVEAAHSTTIHFADRHQRMVQCQFLPYIFQEIFCSKTVTLGSEYFPTYSEEKNAILWITEYHSMIMWFASYALYQNPKKSTNILPVEDPWPFSGTQPGTVTLKLYRAAIVKGHESWSVNGHLKSQVCTRSGISVYIKMFMFLLILK